MGADEKMGAFGLSKRRKSPFFLVNEYGDISFFLVKSSRNISFWRRNMKQLIVPKKTQPSETC